MTVFRYDTLGNIPLFGILVIVIVAVQEHYDVGILLDGAGFTEVRQHGPFIVPLLVSTGQLAQADHRHIQFLGHDLQHTGHFADHLLTVLTASSTGCGGHQLQIVDDYQAQAVDPAAFGVHIRHAQHGVIVNTDIHSIQYAGSGGDLLPVRLPQRAGNKPGVLHTGFGAEKPGRQLLPGHFQRKHGYGLFLRLRHIQRHVQRKGGFAHTGTGRQQDQVRFIQAADLPVHSGQAGGQARKSAFALAHLVEPVQHIRQHHPQRHHILRTLAAADGVDLLLGSFQNGSGFSDALLHQHRDLPRRLSNAPQQRLIPNDGHILHHVGAGGGDLHELRQIGAGGIFVISPGLLHFLADGDAVNRPGVGEHGVDGLKDLPVLPQVEVRGHQLIHHVLDAALVDEHGA